MFQIEDLVAAAFNGGSLDLDAIELLEMTNVVSLQVDDKCCLSTLPSSRDVISLHWRSRRTRLQPAADSREVI